AFARPTPGIRAISSTSESVNSPRIFRLGRSFLRTGAFGASSSYTAPHTEHDLASASTNVPQRRHANCSFCGPATSSKRNRVLQLSQVNCVGLLALHFAHSRRRSTSVRSGRDATTPHALQIETGTTLEAQFRQGRTSASRT